MHCCVVFDMILIELCTSPVVDLIEFQLKEMGSQLERNVQRCKLPKWLQGLGCDTAGGQCRDVLSEEHFMDFSTL